MCYSFATIFHRFRLYNKNGEVLFTSVDGKVISYKEEYGNVVAVDVIKD